MISLLLALALACGQERWDVKVLADDAAIDIGLAPVDATVEDLRAFKAPAYDDANERADDELQVYALEVDVTGFKVEKDGDWHVVVRGTSGATMVVELPDPVCAHDPKTAQRFKAARRQFLRLFQEPAPRMARLRTPVKVRLTGVGFYDKVHGQVGVAPNGIELHPVLTVEKRQ